MRNARRSYSHNPYSRTVRSSRRFNEGCGKKKKSGRGKSIRENRNLRENLGDWSINEFIDGIKDYIDADTTDDQILTYITEEIDRAIIYYADQFKIAWALDLTSWEDADYEITSMSQLAAWGLEDYMYNRGGYNELIDYRDELIEDEDED